jgi:hypothetical protein
MKKKTETSIRRLLSAASLALFLNGTALPPALRAEGLFVPRIERQILSLPNRRLPVKVMPEVLDREQSPSVLIRFENDRPGGAPQSLFIRHDQVDRVTVAGFFREEFGDRRVYAYDVTTSRDGETVDYIRVEYEMDGDRAYLVDRPIVMAAESRLVGQ